MTHSHRISLDPGRDRAPLDRLFTPIRKLALTALLGLSAALPALPGQAQDARLDVGVSTAVNQLVPHPVYQATMPWIHAVFDALVFWSDGPQPQLAESWEMSDGGRVVTVHLRPGVTFHDGKPMTADVVLRNLEWARDPANRVTGNAFLSTGTFTKIDDLTLKLEFPIPAPQILTVFAVLPIMDLDSDLVSKPNGTGPFKVAEFQPATSLVLERNDAYWDKDRLPQVKTLAFPMFPDNASLMAALQSGQIDVLAFPDFRQLSTLQGEGMVLVSHTPPGSFMLRVNTSKPPLDNKLVRQALSHTINRAVFAKLMTGGNSTPSCSHLPSGSPAYTPEVEDTCAYDLDLAKKMLTEAGYPDGFELEFQGGSQRQPEVTAYAPIWQEDLAKIGVKLKMLDLSSSVLSDNVRAGNYQIQADWYPWGVFDPAVFFIGPSFAPNNLSLYADPAYLKLLDEAQGEGDPDKRIALYKQVNLMLADESFIIPIATRPYIYAVRPDLEGFKLDPFGMAYVNDVKLGG